MKRPYTDRNSRMRRAVTGALCAVTAVLGLGLTSCTTEEGLLTGALAGAAIGGVVGHASEHDDRRYRRSYGHRRDYGYYHRSHYRPRHYHPRQRPRARHYYY